MKTPLLLVYQRTNEVLIGIMGVAPLRGNSPARSLRLEKNCKFRLAVDPVLKCRAVVSHADVVPALVYWGVVWTRDAAKKALATVLTGFHGCGLYRTVDPPTVVAVLFYRLTAWTL